MTAARNSLRGASDDAVFQFRLTCAMALVFVAGFSFHFAMGHSSFDAPAIVHIHALVFFGWVALTLLQAGLAATGRVALHRQLGWLGLIWIAVMVPMGMAVTIGMVAGGRVPPDFLPQHFLFDDPATLLAFAGLALAAIALRRDTGWHRRLHLCGLAVLMGPAVGRMIPPPLVMPHAFAAAAVPGLMFPAAMAWREWRWTGQLHRAWLPGLAALPVALTLSTLLANSTLGDTAYAAVTAGTPAAGIPGLAYPPMPPG
jgi:hypothetical protein